MKSPEETLAVLFELQTQLENEVARLQHAAHGVKNVLKRQPLAAELPELLRGCRRAGDACNTTATRLGAALTAHADAEHNREMASRPKWSPSKHASPGQRTRREMMKRGCLVGSIDAPGFGL